MPRTARASVGGYCSHALNRGNGRARVFHDYDCPTISTLFCGRSATALWGLLTVMRYVERNPLRARLVARLGGTPGTQ